MLKSFLLISSVLFSTILYADYSDGKDLFDDSNCISCHELKHFKYRENKVNNYKRLHKTVGQCAYSSKAQWFDDELDDVVKYLNHDFYHFKEKAKD